MCLSDDGVRLQSKVADTTEVGSLYHEQMIPLNVLLLSDHVGLALMLHMTHVA